MIYRLDSNSCVICSYDENYKHFNSDWNLLETEFSPNPNFHKNKWNGTEFIEGATAEEIEEFNKPIVPESVSAIQFIAQLAFEGISETAVLAVIDTLSEPNRTVAIVSLKRAIYFERRHPFISLIAAAFEKTETDIDNIFINASKII